MTVHIEHKGTTIRIGDDVTFDTSRAPLVLVTYHGTPRVEIVDPLFDTYLKVTLDLGTVAMLNDLRNANPLKVEASLRKAMADAQTRIRPGISSRTICEARVLSSRLALGMVTAFDWLTVSSWPRSNFTDFAAAEQWTRKQIEAHR